MSERSHSDLTSVYETARPALWVHGHVYGSFDYRVGNMRKVCNPKGFGPRPPGGRLENPGFDAALVLELPMDGSGGEDAPAPPSPAPQTFRLK